MSISNTTRKTAIMLGNGVSVKFPFSFRINNESDLKVYVKIGVGAYTLKILNTDYKLSDLVYDTNNNIIAGNIEYPIIVEGEPDQPSPLTENDSIYGIRETPKTQEESSEQVSFKSKDMERALDKATMQIQELDETVSRAITVPEYQDIEPSELIDDIYTAAGQASQAAEDASGYANNASTYATNASTSATNASKWAEGTDSDVSPLGGTHSAKGWANLAASSASQASSAISQCETITNNAVASINRPLLSFKWFDHLVNNQSWLRADTFSWQSGETYSSVYQHLLDDIGYVRYMIPNDDIQEKFYRSPSDDTTMFAWTNQYSTLYTESEFPENGDDFYYHNQVFGTVLSTGIEAGSGVVTPTTETIAGTTITFYQATDGHKIVLADQETNVSTIYTATGVAWYYVLDTTNTRFKLPRTQHAFTGLRDTVGKYVEAGLPNITGDPTYGDDNSDYVLIRAWNPTGCFVAKETTGTINSNQVGGAANTAIFDASASNPIYGNSTTVQPPATQMYLYFYVGQFTQSATEQTAGLNAELFNGKLDRDFSNKPSNIHYVVETYHNGTDWYRVWSDGWCEQGGLHTTGTTDTYETITLLKPFANTNYKVYKTMGCGNQSTYNNNTFGIAVFTAWDLTTTSFKTWGPVNGALYQYIWKAEGYIS